LAGAFEISETFEDTTGAGVVGGFFALGMLLTPNLVLGRANPRMDPKGRSNTANIPRPAVDL